MDMFNSNLLNYRGYNMHTRMNHQVIWKTPSFDGLNYVETPQPWFLMRGCLILGGRD